MSHQMPGGSPVDGLSTCCWPAPDPEEGCRREERALSSRRAQGCPARASGLGLLLAAPSTCRIIGPARLASRGRLGED